MELVSVAVLGLVLGRSLNCAALRISLRLVEEEREAGEEIQFRGPDHRASCPAATTPSVPIAWYACLPPLSYRTLPLRCRQCRVWRRPRYWVIDVATALLAVALYRWGPQGSAFVVYAVLASALVVVTVVDIDFKIIPDSISLTGTAIALGASLFLDHIEFRQACLGAAAGAGTVWAIGAVWGLLRGVEAMGLGDVKLLALLGAVLGWQGSVYALFVGSLLGSVIGIGAMIASRQRFDTEIPFGPFLAAGALLFMLSGSEPITVLLNWYESVIYSVSSPSG